jgi:DNA repair exonuclease SbcCD nuclease subunit
MNVIAIGDQHFKVDNIPDVELFINRITNLVEKRKPDFVVLLGDLLDTHERLHTIPLNKAYEFINNIRKISKTYILTGNHDMVNHLQFLTSNHWLNYLKEWNNVTVIDNVVLEIINNKKFIFVPYVEPGRFIEALNTLEEEWTDADCIFAHQEFHGCKMGAIVSLEGDKWSEDYPNVVSGHIHNNQKPQKNIYYPGSSIQIAFGENQDNIIASLTFKDDTEDYELEEIDLKLPKKKIIYTNIDDVEKIDIEKTNDKIKISVCGDHNEYKTFKKTKKYKELISKGAKVIFKPKKIETQIKNETLKKIIDNNTTDLTNFKKIITELVAEKEDSYLYEVFELIINNNKIKSDDILFL